MFGADDDGKARIEVRRKLCDVAALRDGLARHDEDRGRRDARLHEEHRVGRIAREERDRLARKIDVVVGLALGRNEHHRELALDEAFDHPRNAFVHSDYDRFAAAAKGLRGRGFFVVTDRGNRARSGVPRPGPADHEAVRQERNQAEDKGVERDREDRRPYDEAHHLAVGKTQRNPLSRDNVGEFTDLREGGGHGEGGLERPAQKKHEAEAHARRAAQNDRDNEKDFVGVLHEDVPVEHHPHRNEKEDRKGVLQRQRVRRGALGIAALAHHHAGQKGSQGIAHVEEDARGVRDAEREREDRQREEFPRARHGDALQNEGDDAAAAAQHQKGEERHARQRRENVPHDRPSVDGTAREHDGRKRRQKHEDDDRHEVLHDEPAHRDAAFGRVRELGHLEGLRHHHGRRAGEGQTEKRRASRAPVPKAPGKKRAQQDDEEHLQKRSRESHALYGQKIAHREVQAHAHHQEHHAHFGELFRHRPVHRRQPREELHENARKQIADQGRHPEVAFGQIPEDERQTEGADKAGDEREILHANSMVRGVEKGGLYYSRNFRRLGQQWRRRRESWPPFLLLGVVVRPERLPAQDLCPALPTTDRVFPLVTRKTSEMRKAPAGAKPVEASSVRPNKRNQFVGTLPATP